jgi:putative DNA primase/helicase
VHSHCFDAFAVTPRLAICSPEKRCGKTRLLTILLHLCARPLPASNVTAAAVFRTIEKYHPTLLIDEADTFLRDKEELRGVLNSGHTRTMAIVVRTVGDNHEAAVFSTWAPLAIAQIGRLPATLEDRAVVIAMRRRRSDEQVEPLSEERLDELAPLSRRMARWAGDHIERLRVAAPEVPDLGGDRAADNWRPLLAIADLAGGSWPQRAREAARLLQGMESSEDGAGVQLLADLRDLFEGEATERLTSERIVKALGQMEERPWPEWRQGKSITASQVAKLLKPFGIRPKTMRIGTSTPRGYEIADLEDAFSRYLPLSSRNTATPLQNSTFRGATESLGVAPEKAPICRDVSVLRVETGVGQQEAAAAISDGTVAAPEPQAWGRDV